MKQELVRFGVAMEQKLLEQIDALAAARGSTRSEFLRDLARAEIARTHVEKGRSAVAAVTLVYNHHVRELSERLTGIQHELGERVRASMHVHLDSEHCLEVVVLRGGAGEIKAAADRMLGARGVTQGGIEIIAEEALTSAGTHPHDHSHGDHDHVHEPSPKKTTKSKTAKRRSK